MGVDIRRFMPFHGHRAFLRDRVAETLGLHYALPWPNREPETARDWIYYLRSLDGLLPSHYSGWWTVADYLALLDRRNVQNTAALVPYANLRVLACGWGGPRPTTPR